MNKIVISFFLVIGLSCARHEKTSEEDRFQKIQALIDHRDYDAAESELLSILQDSPQNEKARVVYASLFVHKAGITVKDYFTLEKLARDEDSEPSQKKTRLIKPTELESLNWEAHPELKKPLDFLSDLNEATWRFQEMAEKFERIPELDEAQALQVYSGLQQLESLQTLQAGNQLYRGVIKAIYFKFLWKHERFFKVGNGKLCSQTAAQLQRRIEVFEAYASGMLEDLATGLPQSSQALRKNKKDLIEHATAAKLWLDSLPKKDVKMETLIPSLLPNEAAGVTCEI